jgi:hypothetical protein
MSDSRLSPDLIEIEDLLRDERPELTPIEADRVMTRIRARLLARRTPPKGAFMRTRLAITAVLVLGLMTSGTGVGMAVSGIAGGDSAGSAQYPEQTTPDGNVPGGSESLGSGDVAPAADVEATQQVSADAGDDSLPFTGLAAIPVIAVGAGLLGVGAALRRGARRGEANA